MFHSVTHIVGASPPLGFVRRPWGVPEISVVIGERSRIKCSVWIAVR